MSYFNTYISEGVESSSAGYYLWGKHSFNPTGNTLDGSHTWDAFLTSHKYDTSAYRVFPYEEVNGTYVYNIDLTGYKYGQEVFMVYAGIDSKSDNIYMNLTITLPGSIVFMDNWYLFPLSEPDNYFWYGIGIKDAFGIKEIYSNGLYNINIKFYVASGDEFEYYGELLHESDILVVISNFPDIGKVYTTQDVGKIWVEGEHICFICPQRRKIIVGHDGETFSPYEGRIIEPGMIWLEEGMDGLIFYCDEYGDIRRTKYGDRFGNPYHAGSYYVSEEDYYEGAGELTYIKGTSYLKYYTLAYTKDVSQWGKIWVSNSFDETCLMIMSSNGYKYRIGAGHGIDGDSVDGGDFQ
jgi:hypothetical protein